MITEESQINYPITALSLASALNMSYLDDLPEIAGKKSHDWSLLSPMIRDSSLGRFLKGQGYALVNVGSATSATKWLPGADESKVFSLQNQLVLDLIKKTSLAAFPLVMDLLARDYRKHKLEFFEVTASLAAENEARPRFVFAHLFLPHPPLYLMK